MRKKSRRATLATFCIGLTFLATSGLAVDFTADLTMTGGSEVTTGKIYVTPDYYRMDIVQSSESVVVVVDRKAAVTRVMSPTLKQYMEMESQDYRSLMNDPFQVIIHMADVGEDKAEGNETITGHECEKRVISMYNEPVITRWVATDLNFPIKIEYHPEGTNSVELVNIQEGSLDPTLFEVPEDYEVMIDPAEVVEIPDWAEDVPQAPLMVPPFEKRMQAGEMIRIAVASGKSLAVRSTDTGEAGAQAKVVPFKNGKPIKDVSMLNNFAAKGTLCDRRHESTAEVDEFVIRCFEGDFTLEAKRLEMMEKTIGPGEVLDLPLTADWFIEARFSNTGDVDATCIISFLTGGKDVSESPEKHRTIKLKPGKSEHNTYKSDAEIFRISVSEGTMHVKAGQYDSWTF